MSFSIDQMANRQTLRFGDFVLESHTGELWKHGIRVRLRPQARTLLRLLVARHGELVTFEEVRSRLWPDERLTADAIIQERIRQCIRHIRFQLGDSGRMSRYIVSEMKQGYRFVAEVERMAIIGASTGRARVELPKTTAEAAANTDASRRTGPWRSRVFVGTFVLVGFLGALFAITSPSGLPASDEHLVGQSCVQPPAGLVSWWPLDGTPEDTVGGNDGILVDGASFGPGFVGQAVRLDGVDDHVIIPDAPDLNFAPTQAMSVELWVFASSSSSLMHILGKRLDCDRGPIEYQLAVDLIVNPSGLSWGGAIPDAAAITDEDIPRGRWVHLAGTFDGRIFRIYVNGDLEGESPGTLENFESPAALVIGGTANGDVFCATWRGLIDEVTLYRRALSGAEVAAIARAGRAGKCRAPDLE